MTKCVKKQNTPARQVGECQSGRISLAAVDAYLSARRLAFDRALLAEMFGEADFRGEGSVAPRALVATIAGA